jgi:molybdate transport system substrate-binding protein
MKRTIIFMVAILFCSAIALGCIEEAQDATTTDETSGELTRPETEETHSLLVYCGAGIRKPMDELGSLFFEKGDVYMPGATYYFDIAKEKGITDYEQRVAYHVPVIAVPEGNPAGITSLADLTKPGVTVILGDSKAAAIGKLANAILEKNGLYDAVANNTIARGATVNELVVYTSMKQADASIIWADLVVNSKKMEIVEIPREQNIIKIIPIGTLVSSEQKDAATKFVDFVASPEGKAIFEKHGFTAYPDEKYGDGQQ